jgi:hypothetical protein
MTPATSKLRYQIEQHKAGDASAMAWLRAVLRITADKAPEEAVVELVEFLVEIRERDASKEAEGN